MAVDFHGRDPFLLPSQFFTEDDFVSENNKGSSSGASFAWDVPNTLASCGSGLIQTENQEDDCIAELTRRMSQSQFLLQEHEPDLGSQNPNPKLWGFTDWHDQSTLWSPLGSDHGTRRGTPVPALTAVSREGGSWDLFRDAAGIKDRGTRNHSSQKLPPASVKSCSINSVKNPNLGRYGNQGLPDDHLRALRFYQQRQQQIMKQNRETVVGERRGRGSGSGTQQQQSRGRGCGGFGNSRVAPPQQPTYKAAAGSAMRAIFLAGSDSRSGSCGTGVFLPRGSGTPADSRKKQGCSSVLIPARVAQALKLDFDEMGLVSPSPGSRFSLQQDWAAGRGNGLHPPQRWHRPATPAVRHAQMGVSQGWTH